MNRLLLLLAAGGFLTGVAQAQIGSVRSWRKINDVVGGFGGALSFYDLFGANVAALGDVDGDGIPDLAASAEGDDDGGSATGAVYVLHLDTDGSVQEERKISNLHGGLGSVLDAGDAFGSALTALGDLDGDGLTDLAVGAPGDDDGGPDRGAVWILFLSPGGGVRASQKISTTSGGFGGALANRDIFGASLARIGDLDGDGVTDLAVGSPWNDDGGFSTGAVWILFLNPDGTVKAEQKISATTGGFVGPLLQASYFAGGLGTLGDFDGDGRPDLAVGATGDHDGGGFGYRGALWILLLNPDGTVKGEQKISATSGGFGGELDTYDGFGAHIAPLGDLDLDGTPDLAVGALGDDEGDTDQGAYWILFLAPDGTVAREL